MSNGLARLPGSFLLDTQKLAKGIWPWTEGIRTRLPDHYKKRYMDNHIQQPQPVHYRPDPRKYELDKYGTVKRVQNVPIPLTFPYVANHGLWGGEGFVVGLRKKNDNPMKPRTPEIWKTRLTKRIFYSEILDKWMSIEVTPRAMDLIDEAYGLDNYILKTHEVDLKSALGMKLKREMLMTLIKKSMYQNDEKRREAIYNKYKQYIIPEEEVEWLGLTLSEAERKLKYQEEQKLKNAPPLKELFCQQLVEELKQKSKEDDAEDSWYSRLNPFKNEKESNS